MKLAIVTDAWHPQTNGVVTTLENVIGELEREGIETHVIHPGMFTTMALPNYREIRLVLNVSRFGAIFRAAAPDCVHIATEGPLGLAARRYCTRRGIPFSTSLHTKFPEYVYERTRLPLAVGYAYLRWFHRAAFCTLVTTPTQKRELEGWGLNRLRVWGRGVDCRKFRPRPREPRDEVIALCVSRLAVEKNVEAFLDANIDARKVVVGDGPHGAALRKRYPDVIFKGALYGDSLVDEYASADVFVFPSRTDTFGLVMLEAMACGTPVAAYPVTGPRDVVMDGLTGCLHEDLTVAIEGALALSREACRAYAQANDWSVVAHRLLETLMVVEWQGHRVAATRQWTQERRDRAA